MDESANKLATGSVVGSELIATARVRQRPKRPNGQYVGVVAGEAAGGVAYSLKEPAYRLIEAAAANGTDLATIARALGMDRHTFAEIRKRDRRAQEAVEYGRALMSDELHDILMRQARDGVTVAAIFLAKSRAGWDDKSGVAEGVAPKTVNNTQINVNFVKPMSREDFARLIEGDTSAIERAE